MINENDGYVYIAKLMNDKDKLFKIGHCSLSKSRLAEYTKLPYDIKYIGIWRTAQRKDIEQELHKIFQDKRIRGEWFRLNESDIIKIHEYFKRKNIPKEDYNKRNNNNKNLIKFTKWKENCEPEGYDPLYVVVYKNGVFYEQDLGEVPFLFGSYPRGNKDTDQSMKRYPTLKLDEKNISNQTYIHDSLYDKGQCLKAWGTNREECYKKLISMYNGRFESEEYIINRVRTHNAHINEMINMLNNKMISE